MTATIETAALRPAQSPRAAVVQHVAGPFSVQRPRRSGSGLLGTGLLVMYPLVASVAIVISGVMLAGSSMVS